MRVNPPTPDAIIVIFGAAVRRDGSPSTTLRYRVEAAVSFGRRFHSPLFIPTGAKGRYGEEEARVMSRLLQENGYPPAAILREESGTDTLSSACAVTRIIRRLPYAPVFVCSSAYHLPRCLLLLHLAGVAVQSCPPPPVPAAASRWRCWYWRLREAPALPYDTLLMLLMRITRRL